MVDGVAKAYVGWEEVVVSGDKGRRVVHYYLKNSCGGSDLAVVGKEKSVRHMSYAVPSHFLRTSALLFTPASSPSPSSSYFSSFSLKWRSRREVIDWLSSLVSDSLSHSSSPTVDRVSNDEETSPVDVSTSKGLPSEKVRHHSKEFSWLGSPWTCKKRRKHYHSFSRNGVTISVHDFVCVMAEENKSLVAYVEDLYEDMKANNMVVVRWFHKVDEVGIVLPHDVNDREIFFSLCLQELSVECIDGLAAILGTQHFEKYLNEATYSPWEPYLCCRQIDNDDVTLFDITQIQGYWNQEILRYIYKSSTKIRLKITSSGRSSLDGNKNGTAQCHRPKRKNRVNSGDANGAVKDKFIPVGVGSRAGVPNCGPVASLQKKEIIRQKLHGQLFAGSHVEVLSQDSGIRGCWFRCVILKRYQDKVKVRYLDVQDSDETGYLEEWILVSRLAAADELGIRLHGRTMVRPSPSPKGKALWGSPVGAVVDAWWHDGWWEGIIIRKESDCKIHVYFPGERRFSIFDQDDLRASWEWVCNKWNHVMDRLDLVSSLLLSGQAPEKCGKYRKDPFPLPALALDGYKHSETETRRESMAVDKAANETSSSGEDSSDEREKEEKVPNLAKDDLLASLRWSSLKKRRRGRDFVKCRIECKRHCDGRGSGSISRDYSEESPFMGFSIPNSSTVDHDNCKFGGDTLFSAPMPLSNLVMTQ